VDKLSAMAKPMPRAAPVTKARLPARLKRLIGGSRRHEHYFP
jgi:hypothetical protein